MNTQIAANAHTKIRDFGRLHAVHIDRAAAANPKLYQDALLVRELANGDPLAEARLVPRFDEVAGKLLRRLTADPELRADLYQDAFMAVLVRLRNNALRDPSRLAGYISRTVRFLFYKHLRDKHKTPVFCDDLDGSVADTRPTPERRLHLAQLRHAVRDGIGKLRTARDRELLLSLYLDEEDKLAVAMRLALTPRHFDRVSFRGRARLAAQMRRSHPEFVPGG